jgi:Leucine-rich repeat (LRR) protein
MVPNLEELNMNKNQLESISGLNFTVYLKRLHLDGNRIRSLDGVETLKTLEELTIAGNVIVKLDPLIGAKFPLLKQMILNSNQIRQIP